MLLSRKRSTLRRSRVLSREQVMLLKDEFLKLDQDGDGNISTDELEIVLRSMKRKLQATDDEILAAIKDIDINKDGYINLAEYYANQAHKTNRDLVHCALIQRSRIRKEFQRFDADNSGYISREELREVIVSRGVKLTANQLNSLVHDLDKNEDGKIDYEEFALLMSK